MTSGASTKIAEVCRGESIPPRYDLDGWLEQFGVVAGITGADSGFDLALWGENRAGIVMNCWNVFRNSFEGAFQQFVVGHQVHGTTVGVCEGGESGLLVKDGFDGHATKMAGIMLIVFVADCVPVYLLNPISKAVVLLHAGWRGIAGGILEAGVRTLEMMGTTNRSDIVMHCGVSVCKECYEVGPEVVQATSGKIVGRPETLDLRGVLAERAEKLGVGHVTTSSWCTMHDDGRFHSFRSNGERAGRMAAYLGVPLA